MIEEHYHSTRIKTPPV